MATVELQNLSKIYEGGVKAVDGPEEDSVTPAGAKPATEGDVADPLPVAVSSSGTGDERGTQA